MGELNITPSHGSDRDDIAAIPVEPAVFEAAAERTDQQAQFILAALEQSRLREEEALAQAARLQAELERTQATLRQSMAQVAVLQLMRDTLESQVNHDALTHLGSLWALNRRREELQAIINGRSQREVDHDIHGIVVISTDIKDLKGFNAISQKRGDKVLRRVADALVTTFRDGDRFYRRGGDEFIGFFPVYHEGEVEGLRQRIASLLDQPIEEKGSLKGLRFDDIVRIGVKLACVETKCQLVDAEEYADPKTHPENRVVLMAPDAVDVARQEEV